MSPINVHMVRWSMKRAKRPAARGQPPQSGVRARDRQMITASPGGIPTTVSMMRQPRVQPSPSNIPTGVPVDVAPAAPPIPSPSVVPSSNQGSPTAGRPPDVIPDVTLGAYIEENGTLLRPGVTVAVTSRNLWQMHVPIFTLGSVFGPVFVSFRAMAAVSTAI